MEGAEVTGGNARGGGRVAELDYELLDLGEGRKLERFGVVTLVRPAPAARGGRSLDDTAWSGADAEFRPVGQGGEWTVRRALPDPWIVRSVGVEHVLEPRPSGQVGLFPEQAAIRERVQRLVGAAGSPRVLDLFGATGGSSMAAAVSGGVVTYVDAARSALSRARRNFERNGLENIRSLAEDVPRFVSREIRRGSTYDAILLDPPSFGRGPRGEVWKIDRDLDRLLGECRRLLSPSPLFVVLTLHTEFWIAADVRRRIDRFFGDLNGRTESGALELATAIGRRLPGGLFTVREFR
jgi:23S rRNA (cytosine1962-C5)-methyltransferase